MADEQGWVMSAPTDGVVQLHVSSWEGFQKLTLNLRDYPTLIWRGQRREDWPLVATLYRKYPGLVPHALPRKIDQQRRAFIHAVCGRRGPNPPEISSDNEWWSLGQAHGLITPLLDWTSSPYAAAYFAYFKNGPEQTPNRAIYALARAFVGMEWQDRDLKYLEQMADQIRDKGMLSTAIPDFFEERAKEAEGKRKRRDANPKLEFVRPLSDDNARLINQSGVFTRTPKGEDIETFVRNMYRGDTKKIILFKITILDSERIKALLSLNRMNVNHLTLFPDLYGASIYCNLAIEIDGYSDFGYIDP